MHTAHSKAVRACMSLPQLYVAVLLVCLHCHPQCGAHVMWCVDAKSTCESLHGIASIMCWEMLEHCDLHVRNHGLEQLILAVVPVCGCPAPLRFAKLVNCW